MTPADSNLDSPQWRGALAVLRMPFLRWLALLLLVASPWAQADTLLGVYTGIGGWQQSTDGDLRSGLSQVSVENDLSIDDDTNVMAYFALEHPVPVLPNLRFHYSDLETTGAETLTRSIELNGTQFAISEAITSELELTQADAVLYYELLDQAVSFDLGIAGRFVDGRISAASTTASSSAQFSGVLPLLYGSLRIDLPLTGLWISAQAQGLGYEGDQFTDLRAQIGYQSGVGFGLELGWRSLRLEVEEFDELDEADIDISGPYLMLNYHF